MKTATRLFLVVLGALGILAAAVAATVIAQEVTAQNDAYGDTIESTASQPSAALPSSTLSGEVVSTDVTSLVVKTDNGDQQNFVLDNGSSLPVVMRVGDRVDVEYQTTDSGALRAVKVTDLSGDHQATSETGTSQTAAGAPSESAPSAPPPSAGEDPAGSPSGETSGSANTMPRTASPLPLIGLIGLLSLGGALALRVAARVKA